MAPVLLSELPAGPRRTAGGRRGGLAGVEHGARHRSTAPAHALEQEIVPGVILKGYSVTPGAGRETSEPEPPADDVTLYWGLLGEWPATLGISLRPTQGGAFVPDPNGAAGAIVQVDAPAPLHGLATAGDPLIADSYRVPMPPGADGVLLIVYEKTGDGFRNLVELPLRAAE